MKHEKNYQDRNTSRQRSGRNAVRSGKRTDIPDIRNPRYRFTMFKRWLVICVEIIENYSIHFLKSFNEQCLAYQHLQKKYLPIYRMVLKTLRVTWSHRVHYYHWNRSIVKSKANFNAFTTSMFIVFLTEYLEVYLDRKVMEDYREHFETHSYTGRESYSNWKCVCFC